MKGPAGATTRRRTRRSTAGPILVDVAPPVQAAEIDAASPPAGAADSGPAVRALSDWRVGHAGRIGQPCANCAIAITGPFCAACGQAAEPLERSIGALIREGIESVFHADARLWTTLRALVLHPASLTQSYLAGRRVAQTPPLRMFLVVMLLVFFTGGLREIGRPGPVLFQRDSPTDTVTLSPGRGAVSKAFTAWVNPRLVYAVDHQREFAAVLEGELHSTAIAFLPISALLLGAIFVRRRLFLYDHAIFSMHSLSFMGLLVSALSIAAIFGRLGVLPLVVVAGAATHLFVHLRGVYSTSVFGTLVRMSLLFAGSALAVAALLMIDVALGLNAATGT